jgi:hypothetical protein
MKMVQLTESERVRVEVSNRWSYSEIEWDAQKEL